MVQQVFLNLIIAVVWTLLQDEFSVRNLVTGYLLGLVTIFGYREAMRRGFYFRKVWASAKLVLVFLRELVLANVAVARQVLSPRIRVRPGIIELPVDVKSDLEITMLANMITLTPGTLTLDVSPDRKFLYIHVLDIEDLDEAKRNIKDVLEKVIIDVSKK